MDNIIEISHLCKRFGEIRAVDDLSFSVCQGALFAFLGVNGAGKSTTIHILCAQLQKDSGTVTIDGVDLDKESERIKEKLGVVFQSSLLDAPLTVYDNLACRAALYGMDKAAFAARLAELTEMLHLTELLHRPVGKLSGGQRRRIDIARALLHRPEILILDEPTTGLDPQTRQIIWQLVADLRQNERMTVLLTTHYMEEAAEADDVVIIDNGKIAAKGTPLSLKNAYTGDFITLYGQEEPVIRQLNRPYTAVGGGYRVSVKDTAEATQMILQHPELFTDYEVTKGGMDDVFLAVTDKKIAGGDGQ